MEPRGFVDIMCGEGVASSLVITYSHVDTCLSMSTRNWPAAAPVCPLQLVSLQEPPRFIVKLAVKAAVV